MIPHVRGHEVSGNLIGVKGRTFSRFAYNSKGISVVVLFEVSDSDGAKDAKRVTRERDGDVELLF